MKLYDTELISLRELLQSDTSRESIKKALHRFRCEKDEDVESFLHRYAMKNEKIGRTRTYLVVDFEEFTKGHLVIIAYFSLAITATDLGGVGLDKRTEILGRLPGIAVSDYFPGYLLAQIGRDDRYGKDQFDCTALISVAESYLSEAMRIAGGRTIYLDCKDVDKLISHYETCGYEKLFYDTDTKLHKMIKAIMLD